MFASIPCKKISAVRVILCVFLLVCFLSAGGRAVAAYPEKSVNMIVAYAAGGSTDTLARITAKFLEEELKSPFVVVNRTGAGGDIGFTALAKAVPDGYTIGLINMSSIVINPITRPEIVQYRITDFTAIANVVTDPGIMCVRADSPFKTLKDVIDYAKSNPGKLAVSHEGAGAGDHLGVVEFCKQAGIEMNLIQFDGDAPAKAAVLGGHIDIIAVNVSEVAEMVKEGQLHALAVQGDKRSGELPDVSTFAEQGFPTVMQGVASRGFAAPRDISKENLDILVKAMTKIVSNEDYLAELKRLNMPVDFIAGEEYGKYLLDQNEQWEKLWKSDPWM
ncbi:recombinase RecA [Synergistales bacterium]|nr:recombinase RecA [Synergistales bacterium]